MPAIDIKRWMTTLLAQLRTSRQRQLVLLQGPQAWCDSQLAALSGLDVALLLLSNRSELPAAIAFDKVETCLGSESRLVVMDLFDGFNPDVLCIAGGLVRAAGVLILLSPESENWDTASDRYACWQGGKRSPRAFFVEYFFRSLQLDGEIGIPLTPDTQPGSTPVLPQLEQTLVENGETAEQSVILQQIEKWADGKPGGCILISADRGRGKSTCLGLLAARLQARHRLLVSANSRSTAALLLARVPTIEFVAPDQLLRHCPQADLVLIDEAAMIPLPMLRQLTRIYPKLVLATTTGGYEGTGQGFMLRFVADMESRGLQRYRLESPVRWCRGDLLEAWLNRCLLLQAEDDEAVESQQSVDDYTIELLAQPGAAENWPLLRRVYALLNSAHYRTRPSDLRMLMENPDQRLLVAHRDNNVIGVALLNLEGGFSETLCDEIFYGRRRPQGHLLAQMLTAQSGLKRFAGYRGLRVQRIAVAAGCRRRGLGTRLLEYAFELGRDNGLDYMGASFALDPDSASFWQQAGFRLVHVSFARGKSSGNHSVAVLRLINPALEPDIKQLQQRIQRQLPIWLIQFLQTMEAQQVTALLRFADYRYEPAELELQEIEAFASGNKGFELCFASLQRFVMGCIARGADSPDRLLVEKAVQNRDWRLLERESGSDGRRQLQQRLRLQVDALRKAC
ncbi:MAG: tRNA(Met) cytidine acetyltransferase [Gammaproteobacteria bacterium]|nr:MAG: tRNA(Met) cytidine acetyltransferase [Gammaproteobacteria bacterium]UCH39469.1 MAG: tRNA(Met) cytidine acetyltransferase [Gammaproteobacteria bacterium]